MLSGGSYTLNPTGTGYTIDSPCVEEQLVSHAMKFTAVALAACVCFFLFLFFFSRSYLVSCFCQLELS